jgi:L-lactate dehydrogenase (cytochrome)
VLTVDVPMASRRERDIRNGFVAPNWFTWRSRLDICLHPGWAWRQFRAPRRTLKNLEGIPGTGIKTDLKSLTRVSRDLLDPAVTWADLAWLRSKWPGPLLIKGILTADDARRAIDHGIDGIVVSNHGGRQLDSAPAAIEALPDVVAAVKGRAEILLDGGVRRGADVVKAVALGAKAVTVGRPHLFGLATAGEAGVGRALDIFKTEIDFALMLTGVPRLVDLDPSVVRQRSA